MNWQSYPRILRWMMLATVVVMLGGVLLWQVVRAPGDVVVLADGREFTVRKVTYGTQHSITFGPRWLQPFARFLPQNISNRLRVTTASCSTATPSLVVWGGWRNGSPTNQAARLASVADEAGRETEPRYPEVSTFHPNGGLVMAWTFPNFPCQQSTMEFSVHDFGAGFKPIRRGTLRLANPSRARRSKLAPSPFPAEVRDGPWSMRLTRLTSSPPVKSGETGGSDFKRSWGTAYFQMLRNGRSDDDWTVEAVTVHDAASHVTSIKPVHRQKVEDEWFWLFSEPLWPVGEALRIEAEFGRTKSFPASDVFDTPPIMVPTNIPATRLKTDWERHGVRLTSLQFERVSSGPRGYGEFRATHHLLLTMVPPTRGVRLRLLEVHDDQNRPVAQEFGYGTPKGQVLYWLHLPAGARYVTARVALSQSRFAEFVVQPMTDSQ